MNIDLLKQSNKILKITQDIDLQGNTIYIGENSTLVFEGGTIQNGWIGLTNNLIYPMPNDLESYFINCPIINEGYKAGQLYYHKSKDRVELWSTAKKWINVDGTDFKY